jgi:hypothetical protein
MRKYRPAVVEYVKACRELWPTPSDAPFFPGVSIFHLCLMLISAKGADQLLDAFRSLGITPTFVLDKQVAAAREIVGRYS